MTSSVQNYWCPQDALALTEAEIYSVGQTSQCIFVKHDLAKDALQALPELQSIARDEGAIRTSLISSTTSPWMLISTRKVSVRPQTEYVAIKAPTIDGTEIWIVAKECQAEFERSVGFGNKTSTPLMTLKGEQFDQQKTVHPFVIDRSATIVLDCDVTLKGGTGVVDVTPDYQADETDSFGRRLENIAGQIPDHNEHVIKLIQNAEHLAGQTELQQPNLFCKQCHHPVVRCGRNDRNDRNEMVSGMEIRK